MNNQNSASDLSRIIINYFKKPAKTDAQTLAFIENAYGVTEPNELIEFLRNPFLNDGTLYSLIFCADEELRIILEKYIPEQGIPHQNIRKLTDFIISRVKNLKIETSKDIFCIPEMESRTLINNFADKLHLHLPVKNFSHKDNMVNSAARAAIRNLNLMLSREQTAIVEKFTELWPGKNNQRFRELLSLLLKMIEYDSKNWTAIIEKNKYFYKKALDEAEYFQELLKKFPMEYLMAQKIQPPLITADEAFSAIKDIDDLSLIFPGWIIEIPELKIDFISVSKGNLFLD